MTTTPPTRTAPPAHLLRSLQLTVRQRIDGLLSGDHRSASLGLGTELAQIRPYVPGDDVRRIDWNATARTQVPHVRVHVAERALTTWLVLDRSASMAWGTADHTKADVAEGVALAVAGTASRGVNRLGLIAYGAPGSAAATRPPRQGRAGLLSAVRIIGEIKNEAPARGTHAPPGEELSGALDRLARLARGRGLVVIITDLRGERPHAWTPALFSLCARHAVIVVEVRDPREQSLPAVGHLDLVDPETGRLLRVDTSSAKLRTRFAQAAAEERATVADALSRAGAEHVVLATQGDWLAPFAQFLALRADVRNTRPMSGQRTPAAAASPGASRA